MGLINFINRLLAKHIMLFHLMMKGYLCRWKSPILVSHAPFLCSRGSVSFNCPPIIYNWYNTLNDEQRALEKITNAQIETERA